MKQIKILASYNTIIRTLFLVLIFLFPVSVLDVFIEIFFLKTVLFYTRILVLLSCVLLFFLTRIKTYPKPYKVLTIVILFSLFIGGLTKFTIDFLIMINLALIYVNLSDEDKAYVSYKACGIYLYFTFTIVVLALLGIVNDGVRYESFIKGTNIVDTSSKLHKLGFSNPNYVSLLILFGVFIAFVKKYKKRFFIGLLMLIVCFVFTKTFSTLVISALLLVSVILFSQQTKKKKLLLVLGILVLGILIYLLVINPMVFLPENWEHIPTYLFRSNLMSRIHNTAFKLLEIKKGGVWFGGISSKEDNYLISLWASLGVFGLISFLYYSVITMLKKFSVSYRISVFMISMLLLAQIEQTFYSTSFVSILFISNIFTAKRDLS